MTAPVILALAITLLVEVPVVALIFRHDARRMAIVAALATTVTNVAMNALLYGRVEYLVYLSVGEVGATWIEASVYYYASRERNLGLALLASAVANALSFGAGQWLQPLLSQAT